MQLSGTSFAAPVVAGAAAQMLAQHPSWTPDQVKGVLMVTTRQLMNAAPLRLGAASTGSDRSTLRSAGPPNPNRGSRPFLKTDLIDGPTSTRPAGQRGQGRRLVELDLLERRNLDLATSTPRLWARRLLEHASPGRRLLGQRLLERHLLERRLLDDATSNEDAAEGDANATGGYIPRSPRRPSWQVLRPGAPAGHDSARHSARDADDGRGWRRFAAEDEARVEGPDNRPLTRLSDLRAVILGDLTDVLRGSACTWCLLRHLHRRTSDEQPRPRGDAEIGDGASTCRL